MQVARNFFLSREQTYIRKAREILLALEIERVLSKPQIHGRCTRTRSTSASAAYGAAAAARIYYGRDLAELTLPRRP
ncbi:MAG: transglycosylase domain-containing protein [Arhodomonas sp.]|nr:transglycosylase domain-containing protein [Arhodomonas sp.]